MASAWPLTAATRARDTPVLPPVYSITWPPSPRRPSRSAASTIASAMRSFMLPLGFSASILSRIRAPPSGTIRFSSTSEVSPIRSRMEEGSFVVLIVMPPRVSMGFGWW